MFFARSHLDLHNIKNSIDRTKKMSDGIVKIGPFGIGLDGLLGFIPPLGVAYSGGRRWCCAWTRCGRGRRRWWWPRWP